MRPDAALWYAKSVLIATREARFGDVSASFMMIPARIETLARERPARRSRTAPAHSARRLAPPATGMSPAEGFRQCPALTPAYDAAASCGPRHCHNASQLRTPPGDIHLRHRGLRVRTWRAPARNSPGHGSVAVGRMLPWFGFFQPSWGARAAQTVRRWRPLSRRDFRMARPARVDMRLRKPCVLARLRVFGW